ncbi:MAG: hypothetical protein IKE14_07935 [Loktanella sp.]|nr:hypothetical protein [Loktanella sp.]
MQHTKDTPLVQSDIAKTSNPKSDQAIKSSLDRFKQMNWPELHGFLAHLYEDRANDIWVAGFPDIGSASWGGVRGLAALEARGLAADAADLYFCIGPMAPGATRRNLGDVTAQPVLIVDDIGTKVDTQKWDVLFALGFPEPTFRIETSPNNQTWGWKLAGDPTTQERFEQLGLIRAWLVEKGLTDAVMDEARYVRLPGGWNSKPKYRPADAPVTASPAVGLIGGLRGGVVDIDDIGRVLLGRDDWRAAPMPAGGMNSVQLGAALGTGALRRTADLNNPDPLLQLAQVIGLNPVQIRGGVVEALCPNMAAHGDRPETGFAFLGGGLAQCQHASCQHLRSSDFRHLMVTAYDGMIAARRAVGLDLAGLPASAQEFLARSDFARHGAIVEPGDTTGEPAKVVTLANNIAARLADNEAIRNMEREEALKAIVARFVFMRSDNAFYDLVFREVLNREQFNAHEAIKPHFELGVTGKGQAWIAIQSHPGLRTVAGRTYVPGKPNAIVNAPNDGGVVLPHVNTWVPSGVGHVAARPDTWLELVEHVLPDKVYREAWLDWAAYVIQHRGQRTPNVPVIIAGQGVGKDLLMVPVLEIVGHANVTHLDMGQLGSSFNGWARSELVILPELKLSADGRLYNKLKDMTGLTNGMQVINEKFEKPYKIRAVTNFMGYANTLDAIPGLEADDRRFGVYVSGAKKREPAFYNRIAPVLRTPAEWGRVHWFLANRDLTAYDPFQSMPDVSGSKRILRGENLTNAARWVFEACTGQGQFVGRTFLTIGEVEAACRANAPRNIVNTISTRAVRDGMYAAGCAPFKQVRADQSTIRMWFGPDVEQADKDVWDAGPPKEAAAQLAVEVKEAEAKAAAALLGSGAGA